MFISRGNRQRETETDRERERAVYDCSPPRQSVVMGRQTAGPSAWASSSKGEVKGRYKSFKIHTMPDRSVSRLLAVPVMLCLSA